MSSKDIYENYISNEKTIWQHRLTWKGLSGNMPKYSICLTKFLLSPNSKLLWDNLPNVKNIVEYRSLIEKATDDYVEWALQIEPMNTDEISSFRNFSIGAFGEIFYICLLSKINTLVVDHCMYHFTNVAPLTVDNDWGIDGTASYSVGSEEKDCVLQIKFWNPFTDIVFSLNTAKGIYGQAVADELIDPKETRTTIICWLGTEKKLSKFLKDDKNMYKKLMFIDMSILNTNINDQVPFFWRDTLPTFIKEII